MGERSCIYACDPRYSGISRGRDGRRHNGKGPPEAIATLHHATISVDATRTENNCLDRKPHDGIFRFLVFPFADVYRDGKSSLEFK